MSRFVIPRVLLALTLAVSFSAQALEIKKKDDVVFISGDIDPKYYSELKDALTGARALVVGDVSGSGPISMFASLAKLIAGSEVPTVVNGFCGYMCTYTFMAGKQRMFGVSEGQTKGSVILVSKMQVTTNRGLSSAWPGSYSMLSAQLTDDMPRDTLRKYTEYADLPAAMLVYPPSRSYPAGAIFECSDIRTPKDSCTLDKDLSPLKAGFITSEQLFPIPSF